MNKIKSWLKSIKLKQILTIFLAGILMVFSTACNGVFAKAPDNVKPVKEIYSGAERPAERPNVEKALPKKTLKDFEKPKPGGEIQRQSDLGDRAQDRLEKVKDTFDKASEFIHDDAAKALERHQESPTPYSR